MKLEGSYIRPLGGELWLVAAHIGQYARQGHPTPYDPTKSRKLLVHKKERGYFTGKLQEKGLTLVPLRVYPSGRRFKVLFGLGRGKRLHDKRATLKERDLKRQTGRFLRGDREGF
jgi:SsrA-binding protein